MDLKLPPSLEKFNGQDVVELLVAAGDWLCDTTENSPEVFANVDMITWAGDTGLITIRKHFAIAFPNGIKAIEVTDRGLDIIAQVLGDAAATSAEELRTFHRENNTAETWRAAVQKDGLMDAAGHYIPPDKRGKKARRQ